MPTSILIALALWMPVVSRAELPSDYADELVKSRHAKIPYKECHEMEQKIGQLLYINVDGFGSSQAIDPYYLKLVERIQPGGVLPHYNSTNIDEIKAITKKLQDKSQLGLLIGIDFQDLKNKVTIGLGWGQGILGQLQNIHDPACVESVARIDAALHKYAGINNPLGPTIEHQTGDSKGILSRDLDERQPYIDAVLNAFRQMGLETTIKHFPYTPQDFNLHRDNKDTKIPETEIDNYFLPAFTRAAQRSGMMMTTHIFNSNIDPNEMVTFSKIWVNKIRTEVGFHGLLMTDALFMISSYKDSIKKMARTWPAASEPELNHDLTIFVFKAILAGHDMVFLESSSKETEEIWKNLVEYSCRDTAMAQELRARVRESYDRITGYKLVNSARLHETLNLTPPELANLLEMRRTASETCQKSGHLNTETVLENRRYEETRISPDVFICNPETQRRASEAQRNQAVSLRNLSEKITASLSVDELAKLLETSPPDLISSILAFAEKTPDARAHWVDLALQQLDGDASDAKKISALHVLAKFDAFPSDSSWLDKELSSNTPAVIKALARSSLVANFPAPSLASQKAAMPFLDKLYGENEADDKTANAFLALLFPKDLLGRPPLDQAWIKALKISSKTKIALFFRSKVNSSSLTELLDHDTGLWFFNDALDAKQNKPSLSVPAEWCDNGQNCLSQSFSTSDFFNWPMLSVIEKFSSAEKEKLRSSMQRIMLQSKAHGDFKDFDYLALSELNSPEKGAENILGLWKKSLIKYLQESDENKKSLRIGREEDFLSNYILYMQRNFHRQPDREIAEILRQVWHGPKPSALELPVLNDFIERNPKSFHWLVP